MELRSQQRVKFERIKEASEGSQISRLSRHPNPAVSQPPSPRRSGARPRHRPLRSRTAPPSLPSRRCRHPNQRAPPCARPSHPLPHASSRPPRSRHCPCEGLSPSLVPPSSTARFPRHSRPHASSRQMRAPPPPRSYPRHSSAPLPRPPSLLPSVPSLSSLSPPLFPPLPSSQSLPPPLLYSPILPPHRFSLGPRPPFRSWTCVPFSSRSSLCVAPLPLPLLPLFLLLPTSERVCRMERVPLLLTLNQKSAFLTNTCLPASSNPCSAVTASSAFWSSSYLANAKPYGLPDSSRGYRSVYSVLVLLFSGSALSMKARSWGMVTLREILYRLMRPEMTSGERSSVWSGNGMERAGLELSLLLACSPNPSPCCIRSACPVEAGVASGAVFSTWYARSPQ
ncbi:hypothetical protein PENTCL1PPCAC_24110 [Pristionchus entomophagus]|uniref:Uncharacterized protein n=1 Tax=Pristionchus entomophagus TaxID=358040 RepID=A0AAV5U4X9_9BILA|nr:hypothetical protein PENTCL1PPCAC_24110 [Pristionchus entomophagus]